MSEQDYKTETNYEEYKSWPWFQDYLRLVEMAIPAKDPDVLPVAVGESFCKWVLGTPEVRDIVYRGFVLSEIEDELEEMLLGLAIRYFLLRSGISEKQSAHLTSCWQVLKLILEGELSPPNHPDVREKLLRHSWAFKRK